MTATNMICALRFQKKLSKRITAVLQYENAEASPFDALCIIRRRLLSDGIELGSNAIGDG
jgi:hypothetical protein